MHFKCTVSYFCSMRICDCSSALVHLIQKNVGSDRFLLNSLCMSVIARAEQAHAGATCIWKQGRSARVEPLVLAGASFLALRLES